MNNTDHAQKLLLAFVEVFSSNDGHAVLRQRGGSSGYAHVLPPGFDPTAPRNHDVIVELHNGTVSVTEKLKDALKAQPRPDKQPIKQDSLGHSAGPNLGRFEWGLTHDDIIKQWGSEHAFAQDVARLLEGLSPASDGD